MPEPSAVRTLPKSRLWFFNFVLLIASTAAAALMFEVVVRVSGQDHPILWEPDAKLGWRHIPNARMHYTDEGDGEVHINSLGFRDVERATQKDPGVFRIAVFGDSTTEALQVNLEQTYCQLLEKRLRQRGLRAEVLNFGVSGYGPLQDYLLYMERGRQFAPDLVVQAIFLDNDVADGHPQLAAGQRGAPFLKDASDGAFDVDFAEAVASVESYQREPIHTLRNVSSLYRMLNAARSKRAKLSAAESSGEVGTRVPRRFLLYADPLDREWEDAWRTFERVLTRFSADVTREGTAFAVVSMPAGQVVTPSVWRQLLQEHPAMASRPWDLLSPEKRLRTLADRLQLPLIQPTGAFADAPAGEPLFFQNIGHQTARGHEITASVIEREVLNRGLLPAGTR